MQKRAFILLMDSFGIGATADAEKYGDAGANTFGHIAAACAEGRADIPGVRQGVLRIPNLTRLGLAAAAQLSYGLPISGLSADIPVTALYGYASEISRGKDTPSGHWEIAGVPVHFDWGYFPATYPSFPDKLINDLIKQARLPGVLGNKHASGTTIIDELGDLHVQTGQPIIYTSADSVFQIAAHEQAFGLQRLYEVCKIARELVDEYNIGRVIARPFIGEKGKYRRTANRRDYATPPPAATLLDKIVAANGQVIAIGKVADIFAHQGISQELHADDNMELFDVTLQATVTAPTKSLVFTNFVDFDSKYGHRRDIAGYAHALEEFDARLPEFEKLLQPGDLVIITADHGCDPSFPGSDHTREHIPILAFGPGLSSGFIGKRDTFADIGQTIARHLQIESLDAGTAFSINSATSSPKRESQESKNELTVY